MYRMRRMPFGWKFSALLCQLALQQVIAGIVPPRHRGSGAWRKGLGDVETGMRPANTSG